MEETDELPTPKRTTPIPKRCTPGFFRRPKHMWGPWVETRRGKMLQGEREVSRFVDQERTCVDCGEIQLNTREY